MLWKKDWANFGVVVRRCAPEFDMLAECWRNTYSLFAVRVWRLSGAQGSAGVFVSYIGQPGRVTRYRPGICVRIGAETGPGMFVKGLPMRLRARDSSPTLLNQD